MAVRCQRSGCLVWSSYYSCLLAGEVSGCLGVWSGLVAVRCQRLVSGAPTIAAYSRRGLGSGVWVSGAPAIAAYSRRRLTGLVWSGGLGSAQLYLVGSGLVAV